MPSSTSNSNARIPQGSWSRTVLVAGALCVLALGGWEAFWRAKGFKPSLNDDAALWALSRKQASSNAKDTVVLVGASRIQLGINTDVFAEFTGKRPIQLAISGQSPLPVLRDLANDESFRGKVICELMEFHLFPETDLFPMTAPALANTSVQWIAAYHKQNFSGDFERRLKSLLEDTFVFHLPDLAISNLIASFRKNKMPSLPYLTIKADRSRQANYSLLNIEEYRKNHEKMARDWDRNTKGKLSPSRFLEGVQELNEMVSRIQARGGQVTFVLFPTSGINWEINEKNLPKKTYWDVLASHTSAKTIHFKDYPFLSNYECPDGVHLNYQDAIPFTKALAEILYADKSM